MMAFPPVLPDPSLRFSVAARHGITTCGSTPATTRSTHGSIGRRVEVRVTLDEVVVTCAGVEVARHARCLAAAPAP